MGRTAAMRLVVCENGLRGRSGHYHNIALGLRAAAARRGIEIALWSCRDAMPDVLAELGAAGVFRDSQHYRRGVGRWLGLARATVDRARRLAADLVEAGLGRDDVLLFTSASAIEALAVARVAARFPGRAPAAACLNFMLDAYAWRDPAGRLHAERWLHAAALRYLARSLAPGRTLLIAGTPRMAAGLARISGLPVSCYPMPTWHRAPPVPRAGDAGVPLVVCPGTPRAEKGALLLDAIVERAQVLGLGCRFMATAADGTGLLAAAVAPLASRAGVELLPRHLSHDDYFAALARADVVLLPYDPLRYRDRTSGVFAEAASLGKVLVVPAGTWMAERLAAGQGAGTLFADWTAEGVVHALGEALADLPALAARASATAAAWRTKEGIDAFVGRLVIDLAAQGVGLAPA